MDWTAINHYADEIDTWTSLAIKLWGAIAAIIILRVSGETLGVRMARAGGWALLVLGFVAFSFLGSVGWQIHETLAGKLFNGIGGAGLGIIIMVVGGAVLSRFPKRTEPT